MILGAAWSNDCQARSGWGVTIVVQVGLNRPGSFLLVTLGQETCSSTAHRCCRRTPQRQPSTLMCGPATNSLLLIRI
jgi:hypothetical protein